MRVSTLLFLLAVRSFSLEKPSLSWSISLSQGWTHYEAKDLNRIMQLLERQTREFGGFNNYNVGDFNGHPFNSMLIESLWKRLRLGLEVEFWVENFEQKDVPFDGGDRDYRITCADLRDPAFGLTEPAGCVQARETFAFLPITLRYGYHHPLPFGFSIGVGHNVGIMAGNSSIQLNTEYLGQNTRLPDEMEFEVDPGFNLAQKFYAVTGYRSPWGVELRIEAGWRILRFEQLEVKNRRGESFIFDLVFDRPEDGEGLYIKNSVGGVQEQEIFIGHPPTNSLEGEYQKVTGDFSGWYGGIWLTWNWGGK